MTMSVTTADTDKRFTGSIPQLYDQYMVPLIFERYATDLAQRLAARPVTRVLEIAAGTGVVTRKLASVLHEDVAIVATDLNQAMLDTASAIGTQRPVQWRQADAMRLPFPNGMFDAVVCQFGVMFFPDKAKAFAEVGRVLGPGGVFIFNVWDRIEANEFADTVTTALAAMFPDDPPRFMARIPHGYSDRATIARDLASGGFSNAPRFDTLTARSRAESARDVAVAYCQGTPLRNEIEARDASRLEEATDVAAEAIARRFGGGVGEARMVQGRMVEGRMVEGMIQAQVVTIEH